MKKSNKKGFTIVELVIVIAVIAILAAVLIPTFSNVVEKANESNRLQTARNAMTAVLAEEAIGGNVPESMTIYVDGYNYSYADSQLDTEGTSGATAPASVDIELSDLPAGVYVTVDETVYGPED